MMTKRLRTTWNDSLDAKLLDLWEANFPVKKIAAEMGLTETAVQTRASRRGFGKRRAHEVIRVMADGRAYWTEDEIVELMNMRTSGVAHNKIAAHFGRTKSAIHAHISKLDREGEREATAVTMRPCLRCGTTFGSAGPGNRLCDDCYRYNTYLDW